MITLFVLMMLMFLSWCTNNQETQQIDTSNTASIDVQQKCATQAKIFFDNKKADINTWDYQNHYNVNQNKCFILITERFFDDSGISEILYDVFENKEYANGTFGKDWLGKPSNYCYFIDQTKDCKSVTDFNGFIKNYMEN